MCISVCLRVECMCACNGISPIIWVLGTKGLFESSKCSQLLSHLSCPHFVVVAVVVLFWCAGNRTQGLMVLEILDHWAIPASPVFFHFLLLLLLCVILKWNWGYFLTQLCNILFIHNLFQVCIKIFNNWIIVGFTFFLLEILSCEH